MPRAASNAPVLLSGQGDPMHVRPDGMVGKAPPAPLLLPQGLMVAEYLQQERGVVLRKR